MCVIEYSHAMGSKMNVACTLRSIAITTYSQELCFVNKVSCVVEILEGKCKQRNNVRKKKRYVLYEQL